MGQYSLTIHQILHDFCVRTTANGVSRIFNSQNRLLRIMWSLIVVAAILTCISHVMVMVKLYLSVPTSTKVYRDIEFKYPTVTICNKRILSSSVFYHFNSKYPESKDAETNFSSNTYVGYHAVVQNLLGINVASGYDITDTLTETFRDTFFNWYSSLEDVSRYQLDKEMLILNCKVGITKKRCSHSDFVEIRHPAYLRCYTFNASLFQTTARNAHMSEYDIKMGNGLYLELLLFVDNTPNIDDVAFKYDSPQSGVLVNIHKPNRFPLHNFHSVSYGVEKVFKVQYYQTEKVNKPNDECGQTGKDMTLSYHKDMIKYFNVMVDQHGNLSAKSFEYDFRDCIYNVLVRIVQADCNCTPFEMPISENLTKLPFCYDLSRLPVATKYFKSILTKKSKIPKIVSTEIYNNISKTDRCVKKKLNDIEMLRKLCREECFHDEHKISNNFNLLRGLENSRYIMDLFNNASELMRWYKNVAVKQPLLKSLYNGNSALREKNLLKIVIVPEQEKAILLKETRTYVLSSLFAEIGAIMSLYMGITIVTLLEVLELLGWILVKLCCRKIEPELDVQSAV